MIGTFDIVFKNIKRNFSNYLLYFISMVFSIMIYFTFASIQYNTEVLRAVDASAGFAIVFKTASIVIAIFVSIFIWYSNAFFIRKRKKEVALYALLGIKKKDIGKMLFYENIIMGIAALAAGIFIGSLFSKLFTMLLIRLMGFSANVSFMISLRAVVNTTLVFTVLFLIASIHGYRLIYRFKLIELFKAEEQGEAEPKASVFKSIISLLLIGIGYWLYTKGLKIFGIFTIIITLVLTIIGTYMLFSSLILMLIKLSKKNEGRYFRGINLIGTSQLLYRIKTSARTLATIAVLSATTLTAMGIAASFYYGLMVDLQKNYGFTYAYFSSDRGVDNLVEAAIAKHPENKLMASLDMDFALVEGEWPGSSNNKATEISFYMISESSYNEIAKVKGLKDTIALKENEAAVFEEYITMGLDDKDYVGKSITIKGDEALSLVIADFKDYPLANTGMMRRAVVVKDEVFAQYQREDNSYSIKGYMTDNKNDSETLTNELVSILSQQQSDGREGNSSLSSYYLQYRAGLTFSGIIIFVGAFLGLLFLIATGSIIFFKQLSEANDDRRRYEILKNIGVTSREIKSSISRQIFIVFALPLVIGITHSMVASTLLSRIIKVNLTPPLIITVAAYTAIYMVYYFLTVSAYYNIVNSGS